MKNVATSEPDLVGMVVYCLLWAIGYGLLAMRAALLEAGGFDRFY